MKCRGWAEPDGPCGALDCVACRGEAREARVCTRLDLSEHGYDLQDGYWRKVVSAEKHVARRAHKSGKIGVGDEYLKIVERLIEDSTGKQHHRRRVLLTRRAGSDV